MYGYIVLQVHYTDNETLLSAPELDYTGFALEYQLDPTPLFGGVLIIGSDGYVLPNEATALGYDHVDIVCEPSEQHREVRL